jgi:hypothetical protein
MPKPPLAALLVLTVAGLGPAMAARAQGQLVPPGREAGAKPYDPFARGKPADAESAKPAEPPVPAFRITVPLCRKAQQAHDPLAETPECAFLLKAAEDQAKACRQAFDDGDDKVVMSAACRQAAGFR